MTDHIRIRKAGGVWTVRAGGAVLGESRNALELTEGSHEPVIYFPRDDVAMVMMDLSEKRSACPWRGAATHYSLVTESGTIADAAWSYDAPTEGVAAIAEHVAFSPEKVTVEQL